MRQGISVTYQNVSRGPRGHRDLKVFDPAYELSKEVFNRTKTFPEGERYSLTGRICRSSRSVVANIVEGRRKRQYPVMCSAKLADADAEAMETQVWLDFARGCRYLSAEGHASLTSGYEEVGRMINGVLASPGKLAHS
jgi:four helix bundle protein